MYRQIKIQVIPYSIHIFKLFNNKGFFAFGIVTHFIWLHPIYYVRYLAQSISNSELTCFIASTIVTVLPVPGGPKMMYGAPLIPPDKI